MNLLREYIRELLKEAAMGVDELDSEGNHHGAVEYFRDGIRTLVFYRINGRRVSQEEFEQYCRENPNDPVCKPTETPSELKDVES